MSTMGRLNYALTADASGFVAGIDKASASLNKLGREGERMQRTVAGGGNVSVGPDKAAFDKLWNRPRDFWQSSGLAGAMRTLTGSPFGGARAPGGGLWGTPTAAANFGMMQRLRHWMSPAAGEQWSGAKSVAGALDQSLLGGKGGVLAGGLMAGGAAGLAGAGLGLGITAFVAGATEAIIASQEIVRASRRLGITTEDYERLGKASRRLGLDSEAGAEGMERLMLSIGRAKLGGEEENYFRALGIDVKKLGRGDKIAEQKVVARGVMGIKDEATRAAVETKLYGRSGAELDMLLEELAQGKLSGKVAKSESREVLAGAGNTISEAWGGFTAWFTDELASYFMEGKAPSKLIGPSTSWNPKEEADLGAPGIGLANVGGPMGSAAAASVMQGAMAAGPENAMTILLRQIEKNTRPQGPEL